MEVTNIFLTRDPLGSRMPLAQANFPHFQHVKEHPYARSSAVVATSLTGLVVVVGMTVAGTIPVAQADGSVAVSVIPRDASAYGNTYGEWSARWLQGLFTIPAATHPALDTTGVHWAEGQAGPVWFLTGT